MVLRLRNNFIFGHIIRVRCWRTWKWRVIYLLVNITVCCKVTTCNLDDRYHMRLPSYGEIRVICLEDSGSRFLKIIPHLPNYTASHPTNNTFIVRAVTTSIYLPMSTIPQTLLNKPTSVNNILWRCGLEHSWYCFRISWDGLRKPTRTSISRADLRRGIWSVVPPHTTRELCRINQKSSLWTSWR